MNGVRLQLVLAKAGVASRRRAEALIGAGSVTVNGKVVREMGVKVDPLHDAVAVDGKVVSAESPAYVLLYKPKGYVTTADDPEGRQTVFSLLPGSEVRLFAVGRLDFNTEGALLLTNDGRLAHVLMHPSHGVPKIYHGKFRGQLTKDQLRRLREGVELPPVRGAGPGEGTGPTWPKAARSAAAPVPEYSAPAQVQVLTDTGKHTWAEIVLHEGKNRQIHRMAAAVGSSLLKLLRVQYANLSIEGMQPGEHRPLRPTELSELYDLVGLGRPPRLSEPAPVERERPERAAWPERDARSDRERPTRPERARPARPERERATAPQRERPARPERERATTPQREQPTRPERARATAPSRETPPRPSRETPPRPSREAPPRPSRAGASARRRPVLHP